MRESGVGNLLIRLSQMGKIKSWIFILSQTNREVSYLIGQMGQVLERRDNVQSENILFRSNLIISANVAVAEGI